jgi:adenosylcobyric acid synthase
MTARAIMLMGTGSDVGKSLIAAGLCRALTLRGHRVKPFKPQNMSNNAAVTVDGGEIGRAQALQARATKVDPTVHMNPILLKPETNTGAQVIVQGHRHATMTAREYFANRTQFLPAILESFQILTRDTDFIIVEGAGSPGEINLRNGDLANMGFAQAAGVPAVLVGDIHRGGVIASIIGTFDILPEADRKVIKAFLINKFHGDPQLFSEGWSFIEARTATPCLGIIPHFAGASRLPAEDAVTLEHMLTSHFVGTKICVLRLPRIANFDDIDPLRLTPGVSVHFVQPGEPIPGDARLVIIPGSKSTISDLKEIRCQGWDIDLAAHVRRGGFVLGLCGGYQMLGRRIHDPQGIEGTAESVDGLGLLEVETTLLPDKTLTRVTGTHVPTGTTIDGYEIHLGKTEGIDCTRPFAMIGNQPDGAISPSGLVMGTYLHGCFTADSFRDSYLKTLGFASIPIAFDAVIESTLDALAAHLETHMDIDKLIALAEPV